MQESSDVAIARDKTSSERHAQKPTNFTLKEHWFNRFLGHYWDRISSMR